MGQDLAAEDLEASDASGDGLRVAVVCGRFNSAITERLLRGVVDGLVEKGTAQDDIDVTWVPGAFEIPLVAKAYAETGTFDAVVTLGAVIRGETDHYQFVAGECAAGVQRAQLDTGVPVIFGVLTTEDTEQALARSSVEDNKGNHYAYVAVEMVDTLRRVRAS